MSNIKLNYVLTCDQAFFSEEGKASIIGLFDEIGSSNVPATSSKFSIFANIRGDKNTFCMGKIEIINPQDNSSIASIEEEINFKDFDMHDFLGNFINISFPAFGKYWIKISIDGNVISNKDEHYISLKKV